MRSYTLDEDEIYVVIYALKRCDAKHPITKPKVEELLYKLRGVIKNG